LNVNLELNESEYFTVTRMDTRKDELLLVMEYDDHTQICNFR